MLKNNSIKFLEKYLNSFSPTGNEKEGQKVWIDYIKPYVDKIYVDLYGTAVGIINPNSTKKLMVEAHVDEISWYVNYITEDGIIYVSRNGGSDYQIALSKKVVIHTNKGLIDGVFGWPAIHVRKSEDKIPSLDNIFIDVGVSSRKEVIDLGIHIGCIITYPDRFFIMNKYFVGRGMDNKAGGFIIAEAARMLFENKINIDIGLYIVNSVQEEVGFRGAKMIAQAIRPQAAIITDVTHNTSSPMIDKKLQGDVKCGYGPVITYSSSIIGKIRDLVINTANNKNIKFQRLVASGYTGTDTDVLAYSNKGILSSLISIPLKYMHTTVEMVHKYDLEQSALLIFESIKEINNQNKKFFLL